MRLFKVLLLLFPLYQLSLTECNVSDCSLLSHLECALYTTDYNERKLNQAFFPPRRATSRYIRVNYDFKNGTMDDYDGATNCSVSYLWAVGGFLLIQPPTIFQLTSLLFNYPSNELEHVNLTLPVECRNLTNIINGTCLCKGKEDKNLDILTQQIMQYSKFNSPDSVVRDVTSTAQAICLDDLEDGYYNHVNVTLYLSTLIVIPAAAGIASCAFILKHYDFIADRLNSPQHQPGYVAAIIAGLYITLYIIAMDFAAIHYYRFHAIDLKAYKNTLSLHITWITLIMEYVFSFVFSFVISVKFYFTPRTIDKHHADSNSNKVVIFIVALLLGILIVAFAIVYFNNLYSSFIFPGIFFVPVLFVLLFVFASFTASSLICFMVIPIVFVSAHLGYVCAAWLTEPSKTTSVAIISMALTFYMFSVNQFLFKCTRAIVKSEKWVLRFSWLQNIQKEQYILSITFFLGFAGVGLAALQIAAFYTLPLPTIKLANYLDNIVNLSLVILAALVAYKIIPYPESDFKEFIKEFNKSFNENVVKEGKQAFRTEMNIASHFSSTLDLTGYQTNEDDNIRKAFVTLRNCILTIQVLRSTSIDSVIIPISDVKLCIAKFQKSQTFITSCLAKAVLEFTCLSVSLDEGRIASHSITLEDAWIELENSCTCPANAVEFNLRVSGNDGNELKVFRRFYNEKNEIDKKDVHNLKCVLNLSVPGVCIKSAEPENKLGLWCYYNPITMDVLDGQVRKKTNYLPTDEDQAIKCWSTDKMKFYSFRHPLKLQLFKVIIKILSYIATIKYLLKQSCLYKLKTLIIF